MSDDASYVSASRELVVRGQQHQPNVVVGPGQPQGFGSDELDNHTDTTQTFSPPFFPSVPPTIISDWSETGYPPRLPPPGGKIGVGVGEQSTTLNVLPIKSTRYRHMKRWLIGIIVVLVVVVTVLGGILGSRTQASSPGAGQDDGAGDGSIDGPSIDQGEPTSFFSPLPEPSHGGRVTTTSESGSTPTVQSRSICQGRVCPSVLSVAQLSSDPPSAFVFARGRDSAIWYRQTDGEKWLSEWETLGGDMKSQPMAAAVEGRSLHVFAYSRNNTILYKMTDDDGKWTGDDWLEIGLAATSPPYVGKDCSSMNLPVTVRGVARECEALWIKPGLPQSAWYGWENHGGGLSSSPVIWCSPDQSLFRLAVLGFDGARTPLYTRTWMGQWTNWVEVGGDFTGSLAIAGRNIEEVL